MSIIVKTPGMLTTVQDGGRFGYQKFGFSQNGVMDARSYHIANALVGNFTDEAVLEMTMLGGTFYFTDPAYIAITGADMDAKIDGEKIQTYKTIYIKGKSTLSFTMAKSGMRTYLAVAGGLDIGKQMESRSTNLKCHLGGLDGRKLTVGDEIGLSHFASEYHNTLKINSLEADDFSSDTVTLRVVLGPQDDYFTEKGIETFLGNEYTVTENSDRMGYKLDGKKIEYKDKVDIISDGIAPGSIQVPSGGQPIVMLSDRQTTGGYAKIATVISPDLPKLVQSKPGNKINFKAVSRKEAEKINKQTQKEFNRLLLSL